MDIENAVYEEMDLGEEKAASGLGSFAPVQPGVYVARFSTLEVGVTRNGNPQVAGQWTINEGEFEGQTVRDWIVFSPKSGPFIRLRVQALGLPIPERQTTVALAQWFAKAADGRLAVITVANREREDGKVFAEVVNISSAPSRGKSTRSVTYTETDDELPF